VWIAFECILRGRPDANDETHLNDDDETHLDDDETHLDDDPVSPRSSLNT